MKYLDRKYEFKCDHNNKNSKNIDNHFTVAIRPKNAPFFVFWGNDGIYLVHWKCITIWAIIWNIWRKSWILFPWEKLDMQFDSQDSFWIRISPTPGFQFFPPKRFGYCNKSCLCLCIGLCSRDGLKHGIVILDFKVTFMLWLKQKCFFVSTSIQTFHAASLKLALSLLWLQPTSCWVPFTISSKPISFPEPMCINWMFFTVST